MWHGHQHVPTVNKGTNLRLSACPLRECQTSCQCSTGSPPQRQAVTSSRHKQDPTAQATTPHTPDGTAGLHVQALGSNPSKHVVAKQGHTMKVRSATYTTSTCAVAVSSVGGQPAGAHASAVSSWGAAPLPSAAAAAAVADSGTCRTACSCGQLHPLACVQILTADALVFVQHCFHDWNPCPTHLWTAWVQDAYGRGGATMPPRFDCQQRHGPRRPCNMAADTEVELHLRDHRQFRDCCCFCKRGHAKSMWQPSRSA